jgi:hypothetical protein
VRILGIFNNKTAPPPQEPTQESKEIPLAAPSKVQSPDFSEKGNSGLSANSGWISEEFLPKLRWPRAGEIYQEMSNNDPVITAILMVSRQLIRNVTWTTEAASDSPEDLEAEEFLKSCMNDLNMTWSSLVDDILSFFEYGWSYHEIVYKKRTGDKNKNMTSKYDDNRIGWRKIAGRSQRTLHSWEIDDLGSIRGMHQYTDHGTVFIPIERGLLFRTTTARNNPEGKSFLRGAYRPWFFKKHIEEVEGIGIERDLAGLPVVTTPDGVDIFDVSNQQAITAKNNALQLVTSIRRDRNEGVVLPFGWTLELLSSKSSRQFDTNAIINRYDQRIAITMLADIVMLGADKVGSFALAKVKQSMLAAALDAQLSNTVDIFNEIAIPRLFALNTFKVKKLPKIKVTSVIAPDLKELGDYIRALSGAKMPLFPDLDLENYLRKVANLPEAEEDDESREIAKKAATTPTEPPKDPKDDPSNDDVTEGGKKDA